jgi:hypothetical protein
MEPFHRRTSALMPVQNGLFGFLRVFKLKSSLVSQSSFAMHARMNILSVEMSDTHWDEK